MNECQVAELFDGRGTLLMDMRSYFGRSARAQSLSTDGGKTWSPSVDAPTLVEPVCQASLLRHDAAKLLLFSNPAHPKQRVNLTVRASADDAKTWRDVTVLHAGPSAYSSLVALDANTAACLYENGDKKPYERITFARFPLQP
jgi:sialidase-1